MRRTAFASMLFALCACGSEAHDDSDGSGPTDAADTSGGDAGDSGVSEVDTVAQGPVIHGADWCSATLSIDGVHVATLTNTFDDAGRRIALHRVPTDTPDAALGELLHQWDRDDAGRLTRLRFSVDGAAPSIDRTYAYDDDGNLTLSQAWGTDDAGAPVEIERFELAWDGERLLSFLAYANGELYERFDATWDEATGRLLELTIDGESEARFTYYPDDSPWAGLVAERITPTGPDLYTVVRYTYDAERRLDAESVEIRKRADDAPYTTKRSFAWIRDARDRPQRVADGFPFFDDYSSSRSRPTFTYDQGTVTELRSRSVEQDWCRVTYDSATVREGQAWAIYRVQQIPYGSLAAFEGAPGYGTAGSRGLFEDSLLASTCGFDVFTEVVRDDDGRWVSGTTGLSDGRVLDIAYAFDCWPDDATLPPLPEPPPNVDVGPTTRAYPGPCTVRHVGDLGITTSLTRFAYDADGRATKAVIRGNEEVVTRFMGYDDAGRLVSVLNDTPLEEGLGTPSTVTYDDDGLITEVSAVYCGDSVVRVEVADGRYASHEPFLSGASRGYVERYAYDAAGERVVRVWRTATADGSIQEDTSYTYVSSGPAAGKLARIERRAPAALTFNANVDFTYDTATGALAQTTFVQVDLAGSPLAQPIVSSWSVTGDGEVTARVGGEATIYAQDGGRLAAIDPETGCETVYEGRLVEKQTQLVVTIGEAPCLSPSFQRPYADYVVEGVRVAHVCADGPTYERTTDGFGNVLTEVDADGTTIYGYTCWEE